MHFNIMEQTVHLLNEKILRGMESEGLSRTNYQ